MEVAEREEEKIGSNGGSIATQVNKDKTLPKMEIQNFNVKTAKNFLTEEELARVEAGEEFLIYFDVRNADDNVPQADKDKTEQFIEEKLADGEVGMYLDLSLFKKIGDDAANKVTDTNGTMISVTVEIPESLRNTDANKTRMFYVVRVHNGVAEFLTSGTTEMNITFETGLFSTYAIVYSDVDTSIVPDGTPDTGADTGKGNPQTGDTNSVVLWMMLLVAGCGVAAVAYRKRRVNE